MLTTPPDGASPAPDVAAVPLVEVVRDGVVESVHRGHVAVITGSGVTGSGLTGGGVTGLGRPALRCYARSALKPVQAATVLTVLESAGLDVEPDLLAIAAASHDGSPQHTARVLRLLARGGATPADLRCPPDWPLDPASAAGVDGPGALTHNCSGKHAAFLWAQRVLGGPVSGYLDVTGALQERVAAAVAAVTGLTDPGRPGVDGCGAPAWRVPLDGLARCFATATRTDGPDGDATALDRVAAAMRAHPVVVGGPTRTDTRLMRGDGRVLAKRGAEGVLGAGFAGVGVAVKIVDGAGRATGPVVGHLLQAFGAQVAGEVLQPAVLGGGRPHGQIRATAAVRRLAQDLAAAAR